MNLARSQFQDQPFCTCTASVSLLALVTSTGFEPGLSNFSVGGNFSKIFIFLGGIFETISLAIENITIL